MNAGQLITETNRSITKAAPLGIYKEGNSRFLHPTR
jgi:hypothetical protein